jgi:hypothetical protein
MRVIGLLCTTLVVVCLNPTSSYGQGGEQHRSEEQSEPYHKHHDTRHGHDHFYPDRGAIVRDLPKGTIGISYAGVSYRYHDGIWLEARGPAFMVVAPPIGLVAPTLPLFSTIVTHAGETYLYANDIYYRPRPDLGGYEVVNDPVQEPAQAAPEALVGGQLPAAPVPTQTPAATPASTSPMIAAGLAVPVSSATAGMPAAAQTVAAPIASQAVSFTPPVSASMTAAAPAAASAASAPATNAASTAGPAATASPVAAAGLAAAAGSATAGSAAVPVALPAGPTLPGQKGPKVFLYPKNGQSSDQQAHDRYDCYRFAVAQSGFDPMRAGSAPAPAGEMQSDYERAQSACFEARGYASR